MELTLDQPIGKEAHMHSTSAALDSSAVIDLERLRRNVSADADLLGELALIFNDELPGLQAQFGAAIEDNDGVALGRIAHRVKGSLLALGAHCASIAETIEIESQQGCMPEVVRKVASLQIELDRIVPALHSIIIEGEL